MGRAVILRLVCTLALLASGLLRADATLADPLQVDGPDFDVPQGHFFSEAVPNGEQAGLGFTVFDGSGAQLWTAFQSAGGVDRLGYPTSRRFELNGDVGQAFSHAILIWSRTTGEAQMMPGASLNARQVPPYALQPEKPPVAVATVDPFPWSGWWWPAYPGVGPTLFAADGPLDKYDQYVQATGGDDPGTRAWERANVFFPGISWAGHCNGFAAAALLEPEPTAPVSAQGITFSVADLKGLLSDYHFADAAVWSFGDDDTVNPADFHRMLLDWVQHDNKGFAVSFGLGDGQTWSYPLGQFQTEWAPDSTQDGLWHVTTTVWMADMNVPADFVGTRLYPGQAGKTFTYDLYGDPRQPSDGSWTGASTSGPFAHPGRIWYPRAGITSVTGGRTVVSPQLDRQTVESILDADSAGGLFQLN